MTKTKVEKLVPKGSVSTLERVYRGLTKVQKLQLQFQARIPDRTLRRWYKSPGMIPVSKAVAICHALKDITGEMYSPMELCQTEIVIPAKLAAKS